MPELSKAYHPLHNQEFKNLNAAQRKLLSIGAKYKNTLESVDKTRKSKIYSHPEYGDFSAVDSGKKTTIYHFPMSKKKISKDVKEIKTEAQPAKIKTELQRKILGAIEQFEKQVKDECIGKSIHTEGVSSDKLQRMKTGTENLINQHTTKPNKQSKYLLHKLQTHLNNIMSELNNIQKQNIKETEKYRFNPQKPELGGTRHKEKLYDQGYKAVKEREKLQHLVPELGDLNIQNSMDNINILYKAISDSLYSLDSKNKVIYDKEAARLGALTEYDAINLYEMLSSKVGNAKLKEILLDIAREEKVHVGEFEAILSQLDSEHAKSISEGISETKLQKAFKTPKFNEDELINRGYTKVSNGNTEASIEDAGTDSDTDDEHFEGSHPYTISQIESKKSGTGSGSHLLGHIKNFAKKRNTGIILTPDAKGPGGFSGKGTQTPLSQDKLKAWYSKHGFKEIAEGPEKGSMKWHHSYDTIKKEIVALEDTLGRQEILNSINSLIKQTKTYLHPGETAPQGAEVMTGPKGAKYYIDHSAGQGPQMSNQNNLGSGDDEQDTQLQQDDSQTDLQQGQDQTQQNQMQQMQAQQMMQQQEKAEEDKKKEEEDKIKIVKPSKDKEQLKGWVKEDSVKDDNDSISSKLSKTLDDINLRYDNLILNNLSKQGLKPGILKNMRGTNYDKIFDNINNIKTNYNKLENKAIIKSQEVSLDKEDKSKLNPTLNTTSIQSSQNIMNSLEYKESEIIPSNLQKDIDQDSQIVPLFLQKYKHLSVMGPSFETKEIDYTFKLAEYINLKKQFNIKMDNSNRLECIISIDSIAHQLHLESHEFKKHVGEAKYPILDELASLSKAMGEDNRLDRLIILNELEPADELRKLDNIEIINKSLLNSKSMWKLMENSIKNGVDSLSDSDLILLREWCYSKI